MPFSFEVQLRAVQLKHHKSLEQRPWQMHLEVKRITHKHRQAEGISILAITKGVLLTVVKLSRRCHLGIAQQSLHRGHRLVHCRGCHNTQSIPLILD